MNLNKKILLWVLPFLLLSASCSKTNEEELVGDDLTTIRTEVPWFGEAYYFALYGRQVIVKIDEDLLAINQNINPKSDSLYNNISDLISNFKNNKFDQTIKMLIDQSDSMKLDDFGYRLLLKKFAKEIFQDQSKNFREVILWYGLRSKNLDATIYTNQKKIACFFQSNDTFIVQKSNSRFLEFYPFFKFKDLMYWNETRLDSGVYANINELGSEFFPEKTKNDLKFENYEQPLLGKRIQKKRRSFNVDGRDYEIVLAYNRNLVKYLNDIPMRFVGNHLVELKLSDEAQQRLNDKIPGWLEGKTYPEKVDFLLKLVDGVFTYERDPHEKFNFVEQSFYEDNEDCEDRGVLFCYLAKKFIGAEIILLYGAVNDTVAHVCGGIKIQEDYPLEKGMNIFRHNGHNYLLCDPGASPGETAFTQKNLRTTVGVLK